MLLQFAWLLIALAGPESAGADSALKQEVAALLPHDLSVQEEAVLDNLEERARRALGAIPHSGDRAAAEKARPGLRRQLLRSLGLDRLPWPPELKPRKSGTISRAGYRIEKIVYQTLPDLLVPAHLYVPDGLLQPAPAVLFYPGHWWADSKSRPDFQAFCINMARLGFIVLSFDPFGQGERGVSARDHRRTEALLVGIAQQGIAVYETRCALEYLRSRKEVDPARIGITGASGGGYNTWITAALDERIATAVPVVGTSEFAEQIHVCRPLDWYQAAEHCHYVPGLCRYANNHELLALCAPRPLLVVAASQDQSFPIAGVRAVYNYGRSLYASYSAGDRIRLFEDRLQGHGYQRSKREAAYGWFLRYLMQRGDGSAFPENPTATPAFDSALLRCFAPGQNQPAGPAIIAWVKRLARALPPLATELDLQSVLGRWPAPEKSARGAPSQAQLILKRARLQRLLIETEPGITIPTFLLQPHPNDGARGVLVALDDRGKEAVADEPLVEQALERGWSVCGLDPRGIGESATTKRGWVFAVSLLLGENFVGREAWDLRRTIEQLAGTAPFRDKPVALYARGPGAALAATYALAPDGPERAWHSRLACYILRDGFLSFRAFFERPRSLRESYRLLPEDRERTTGFDREIPAIFFPFDALHFWDLPQLLAASGANGLVVNPIDGDWDRLGGSEARNVLPGRIRVVSQGNPQAAMSAFIRETLR